MPSIKHINLTSIDGVLNGRIEALGGKLAILRCNDQDIFWQAPWRAEAVSPEIPPMVSQMAGEWVALPFGCVEQDDDLFQAAAPHGLPANQHWQIEQVSAHEVVMHFYWPEDYALSHAQRRITFLSGGRVAFELSVEARRRCRLPVGLHPVFPIGGAAGPLQVISQSGGMVYPQPTEPGISRLAPGACFSSLQQVPAAQGGTELDISQLPLSGKTEELVQLLNPQGEIRLHWPQRHLTALLSWDKAQLPGCLLWISNAGRDYAPWNGRNYSLGVEPVCSAWDRAALSLQENPLTELGQHTALEITPQQPLSLAWQLTCITE